VKLDLSLKIQIDNLIAILKLTATRIRVVVSKSERIILQQKLASVNCTLGFLAQAQVIIKTLLAGANGTNTISTSAAGLAVFNLVKSINVLLPDLGSPQQ